MKKSCMNCIYKNVLIDEYPCFKCTKEDIKWEGLKESYNKILKQRDALYKACENLMEIQKREMSFEKVKNTEKHEAYKKIVDAMRLND